MSFKTGKETLIDRSRRFVGDALEQEEAQETTPEEPTEPTVVGGSQSRRRAQVLQAQRAHRQRTQCYIRALENEVLRLRDRGDALAGQNTELMGRLEVLTQELSSRNSPTTEGSGFNLGDTSSLPSEGGPSAPGQAQDMMVTVDLSAMHDTEASKWCSRTAAEGEPKPYETPIVALPSAETQSSYKSALDIQTGINFILELERPCLPHVKYRYIHDPDCDRVNSNPPDPMIPGYTAGPAHIYTAAEQIVNMSQQPQARDFSQPLHLPKEQIDTLLNTSLRLNLDHEITPVQIWSKLSSLSALLPIGPGVLAALKSEFMKYIRCNSFGAVIEKVTANQVLAYFFPGVQVAWP